MGIPHKQTSRHAFYFLFLILLDLPGVIEKKTSNYEQNNWKHLVQVQEDTFPEYLSTTAKGDKFAASVLKMVPQTEADADFWLPVLCEKKSGDEGVDMIATCKDESRKMLYIQSKLWLDRAEKIDSVMSNFQAYTLARYTPTLFDLDHIAPRYLLVTLSSLDGILKNMKAVV